MCVFCLSLVYGMLTILPVSSFSHARLNAAIKQLTHFRSLSIIRVHHTPSNTVTWSSCGVLNS